MQIGSGPKEMDLKVFLAQWPAAAAARERVRAQPLTPRRAVGVPLRVAKPPGIRRGSTSNWSAGAPRRVGEKASRTSPVAEKVVG